MKIFLSFASEDKHIANRVSASLRLAKHNVFYSEDTINPAADFIAEIARAVNASDLFIFLISPDSIKMDSFTQNELGLAKHKWPNPLGHVLPIEVRDTPLESIPGYLASLSVREPEGNPSAWVVETVKSFEPGVRWKKIVGPLVPTAILLIGFFAGFYLFLACEFNLWGCFARQRPQIAELSIVCKELEPGEQTSAGTGVARIPRTPVSAYVLINGDSEYVASAKQTIASIIAKKSQLVGPTPDSAASENLEILSPWQLQQRYVDKILREQGRFSLVYKTPAKSKILLPVPTKAGTNLATFIYIGFKTGVVSGEEAMTNTAPNETIELVASANIEPRAVPTNKSDEDYPPGYAMTHFTLFFYEDLGCWETLAQ